MGDAWLEVFQQVLPRNQFCAAGKLVARAYREEFGEEPPRRQQFVDGAPRQVKSYRRSWLIDTLKRFRAQLTGGSWTRRADNSCTSPGLGHDGRSMRCTGDEPRDPPPAAAAGGAHSRQALALPPLGLHPGPGATAVASGERGGHQHRLEPAASAALNATKRA